MALIDGSRGMKNSCSTPKNKSALKKGPWTASEDMMLIEFVKKHGEGNWNAVQRNSGLMRCGKSCRLRWANHLRPNLKKGAFSSDEERLIIELHAKLGNKWARMAAQLPGRTDNEIKNYWNTRLKRRQRAGLPIYPQEMQQELQQYNSSSPTNSLSSFLNSSHPANPNLCFYKTFQSPSKINPLEESYLNQHPKLYRNNDGSLSLSLLAPNPSFSSSTFPSAPYLYRGLSNLPSPSFIPYNHINYGMNSYPNVGLGLSSIPSMENVAITPSDTSSNFVMASSSDDGEDNEVKERFSQSNNTGLLEDMLGESQAFTGNEKQMENYVAGDMHEKSIFGIVQGNTTSEINDEGKEKKAAGGGTNPVDDDLLNLLDNFPLSIPIPDWNHGNGHESPDLGNGTTDTVQSQPNALEYNTAATSSGPANQDWNFGSNLWNNMPGIY